MGMGGRLPNGGRSVMGGGGIDGVGEMEDDWGR